MYKGEKSPIVAAAANAWLGVIDQSDSDKETQPTTPRTEGREAESRQAKPRPVTAILLFRKHVGGGISRAKSGPLSWDTPLCHRPRDLRQVLPPRQSLSFPTWKGKELDELLSQSSASSKVLCFLAEKIWVFSLLWKMQKLPSLFFFRTQEL